MPGKIQNPLAVHDGWRFSDPDYHPPEIQNNQYIKFLNTMMENSEFLHVKL